MAAPEHDLPRLPKPDHHWEPRPYPSDELMKAILHGGMAGVVSHPLDNVLWKIGLLCDGDERSQFGLKGVCDLSEAEVLQLVSEGSGWWPEPESRFGPFRVAAERVLEDCGHVGDRLAIACERHESVILATGHPTGLPLLYIEIGRELAKRGVELLTPFEGTPFHEGHKGRREIRYFHDVAM